MSLAPGSLARLMDHHRDNITQALTLAHVELSPIGSDPLRPLIEEGIDSSATPDELDDAARYLRSAAEECARLATLIRSANTGTAYPTR